MRSRQKCHIHIHFPCSNFVSIFQKQNLLRSHSWKNNICSGPVSKISEIGGAYILKPRIERDYDDCTENKQTNIATLAVAGGVKPHTVDWHLREGDKSYLILFTVSCLVPWIPRVSFKGKKAYRRWLGRHRGKSSRRQFQTGQFPLTTFLSGAVLFARVSCLLPEAPCLIDSAAGNTHRHKSRTA